ncbi:MAG: C69 family dipeptidase [Bacteroidetes bacterium]|nr:C69 family dipeptidase [Bacteroidota bacterium]
MIRKFWIVVLLFVGLMLNNINNACTNFIVTKGASKDGSVMITYSADSYQMYGELYHWKAAVYPKGTMLEIYEWDTGKLLGKIPEAEVTYNVVGNINENQVSIGETTFVGREELINEDAIMDYGSLIYIALQRARSAKDAIKIMTGLVAEHGYYSSGESFSIADKNEAWILELIGKGPDIKGAVWVARRIPDGYVSGHANYARIQTFPKNDPENCLYSEDVISFAREKGYYSGSDDDFDFAQAYNPLDFGNVRYCDARVWSLFRRVNKDMDKYLEYIRGNSLERMPLWIKPDEKLSVQDVMHLMRDHFEGTEMDMTKGAAAGPYGSPYRCSPLTWDIGGDEKYFSERPISTYQTGFSFVSQLRSQLPDEVGGIIWFGMDDTYMTVYTPMYCSMTEIPQNYRRGLGSLGKFTWESAFWVFNSVSNFIYPRYSLAIDDLQRKQNEIEGGYLQQLKTIEETALSLLKKSKGEAVDYLTKYSIEAGNNTYNTWKDFFGFMMMKYIDGVVKDEYAKPKRVGYPLEFRKHMVEQTTYDISFKELNTDTEVSFNDLIKKGDSCLSKMEYKNAKEHYEKALELKAEDSYPKEQLAKIEKMLASMEELHKTQFAN